METLVGVFTYTLLPYLVISGCILNKFYSRRNIKFLLLPFKLLARQKDTKMNVTKKIPEIFWNIAILLHRNNSFVKYIKDP